MSPTTSIGLGAVVAFNVPPTTAGHGEKAIPGFTAPAIVQTVGTDGSCSLTYFHRDASHYVPAAVRGTGPGQWTTLTTPVTE